MFAMLFAIVMLYCYFENKKIPTTPVHYFFFRIPKIFLT